MTDDRVRRASIERGELSLEECVRAVEGPDSGAVVTFAGVVRNEDGGRRVRTLEYSAHPSAEAVLARVASEVVAHHLAVRVAVAHRVGPLVVGDLALAAAVASAHRAEAFAAAAELVDRVKEMVPIWKQQGFTDGDSEWVASLG